MGVEWEEEEGKRKGKGRGGYVTDKSHDVIRRQSPGTNCPVPNFTMSPGTTVFTHHPITKQKLNRGDHRYFDEKS